MKSGDKGSELSNDDYITGDARIQLRHTQEGHFCGAEADHHEPTTHFDT
jgi:hypothetical protein